MAKSFFLSENFFNDILFSGHTVAAEEETSGYEAVLVGTGRREQDYWTPTTANSESWIGVTCDRVRLANAIAIDRDHNLSGATVRLRVSSDSFTTYKEIFAIVIPSVPVFNQLLTESPGVRTEEGAWLFRFTPHAGKDWRLYIDAMGASIKPQISGLWLGQGYQPIENLDLPWDDESGEVFFDEAMSPRAWVATTDAAQRRSGTISLKMGSRVEHEVARYHLTSLFRKRLALMWIVFDQDQAEKAVLALTRPGTFTFPQVSGWAYRQTQFGWIEHEPKDIN